MSIANRKQHRHITQRISAGNPEWERDVKQKLELRYTKPNLIMTVNQPKLGNSEGKFAAILQTRKKQMLFEEKGNRIVLDYKC